jgi:membrane protein
MSGDMDFEQKDDVKVKEILDDMNSDVQVKKSKLPIILLALLYGTALYGFIFSFIANIILLGLAIFFSITLFITFFVVMVLQVRSIESAKKIEDIDYCLNTYFLYKYITAPFIWGCGRIVASMVLITVKSTDDPIGIAAAVGLLLVPYIFTVTVLIGLPCIITIDFTLDIARKKFGMSYFKKMIHFFLQLIPIADLIDGFYISIKYWKKGRVLAIVTAVCSFIIIAILAFIYSGTKSLG